MRTVAARILTAGACLAWVARAAPIREAAIGLEPAASAALFTAAVLGAVIHHAVRRRGDRASLLRLLQIEGHLGGFLRRWGWALAILAFLLPLWRHTALKPTTFIAAYESLWGRIPFSDAESHVDGGMRLLAVGHMGPYSAKRPLPACLLSVRLAVTGRSLPAATSLQAALLGLAAWLTATALALRFGIWAGLGFFAVLLGLARDYIPTELTEPTGLLLASLALAVFIAPQARQRALTLAAALFVFAAALGARPGPQLLLPFLLLWAVFIAPRPRARALVACGLAVGLGILLPRALNRAYGTPESSFDTFSAWTLYGLTRNSNYTQAWSDFGIELRSIGNEHDVARFLYRKSLQQMRREPSTFLKALWTNGTRFLIHLPRDLCAVISPRLLVATPSFRFRRMPRETTWDNVTGGVLLGLALAGLVWHLVRTRDPGDRPFWLASFAGLALSAPFVYANAGFRTLTVGYPFLAAAVGVGLATTREPRSPSRRMELEARLVTAALLLGLGLVGTAVVGPPAAHWLCPRPDVVPTLSPTGSAGVVSLADSPTIRVIPSQRSLKSPEHPGAVIDRGTFLRWIAAAEVSPKAGFDQLRPPFVIFSGFDYLALRQRLFVAPPEILDAPAGWLRLDLQPVEGSVYLTGVTHWQSLR
jgi:hypothetical protein